MLRKTLALLLVLSAFTFIFSAHALAGGKNDHRLFQYSIIGTSKTYINLETTPGEQVSFSVRLTNTGNTKKSNTLFISDGITAKNGGTAILTPAEAVRDNTAAWFNITEKEVTLEPGEQRVFDFVAAVPADAQGGDHVAVIYLRSGVNPGLESDKAGNGASFVINEVYSLSSAVILRTPGEIQRGFYIDGTLKKKWIKEKDLTLFFEIANTGNVYDYPFAQLELMDDNGSAIYTSERDLNVVYPSSACAIDFSIPSEYADTNITTARLTLEYDNGTHTAVQDFSLTVTPEEIKAAQKAFEKEETGTSRETDILPIVLLLVMTVFIALLFRFVVFRSRRKNRRG